MKIFLVFGSTSDNKYYEPLKTQWETEGHQVQFHVLSAHRRPKELKEKLNELDYDIVVAGAGLAAHLPGVVASYNIRPVIGLPVPAQYDGLDAFLSILQMPYGVPVLTADPVESKQDLSHFFRNWERIKQKNNLWPSCINVVLPDHLHNNSEFENSKDWLRFISLAQELEVDFTRSTIPTENTPNIMVITQQQDIPTNQSQILSINVPFLSEKQKSESQSVLMLHQWSKQGGIWVGTNNLRNALVGLMEMFTDFNNTNQVDQLWNLRTPN